MLDGPIKAPPLSPCQIREYSLPFLPSAQVGLDPESVYQLLDRVANQVAALNVAIDALAEENRRLRQALRLRRGSVTQHAERPEAQHAKAAYPTNAPYRSKRHAT